MAENIATLADPTVYGHEPGHGPLRVGGQGMPPDSDKDKPSTRSMASARQQSALRMVRDLWEGTEEIRNRAQTYLPQAPGEQHRHYAQRLDRSVFYNGFKRSAEALVGLVFRKDPKLGDDVPAQIVAHWENIDNAGTHGDVFCRDIFQDDIVAGHAAILVEFPDTGGEQDARAEMTGGVRPYWVWIRKEDIVSWRTAVVKGRTVLTQVVIRERTNEPVGRFGEQEVTRYRHLYLADDGQPSWSLLEETKDGGVIEIDAGIFGNQEEIPLAEIVSSGRRGLLDSDPPLKDLAYLNVAHYQMWSDYNWSIHKTCVPFIFGAGIPESIDPQTGKAVPFTVGANTAVLSADPNAKLEYVSHSGESLGSVEAAMENLKSDMGSLGAAMLAPQKRTAETAEAKRLDKATSDSALAVAARGLQDGIERALGFHARYMRLDTGGSIEINRDFEGLLMDAPVMQAYATLVKAGFPPMPVLQALQAGGRIKEDEDLDALELEWMAGAAAAEAMDEAERDMDDAA